MGRVEQQDGGLIMINWEQIAQQNGLTPEEFTKEILTCAAVVGAMELDKNYSNRIRFTCSDQIGEIEVTVKRKSIHIPTNIHR